MQIYTLAGCPFCLRSWRNLTAFRTHAAPLAAAARIPAQSDERGAPRASATQRLGRLRGQLIQQEARSTERRSNALGSLRPGRTARAASSALSRAARHAQRLAAPDQEPLRAASRQRLSAGVSVQPQRPLACASQLAAR